jgi:hypothetical protein
MKYSFFRKSNMQILTTKMLIFTQVFKLFHLKPFIIGDYSMTRQSKT